MPPAPPNPPPSNPNPLQAAEAQFLAAIERLARNADAAAETLARMPEKLINPKTAGPAAGGQQAAGGGRRFSWGALRGAAESGSLGRVSATLAGAIPVIGKFAGAVGAAAIAADKFAEQQLESMRRFAASPAMAMVLAQSHLQDMRRAVRLGGRLAPSAQRLSQARQRAESAGEDLSVWWETLKNDVSTAWFEIKAGFLEALGGESQKDRERKAAEDEQRIRAEAAERARELGLNTEQMELLTSEMRRNNRIAEQGAFSFFDIGQKLAEGGKAAHDAAAKRLKDIGGGR